MMILLLHIALADNIAETSFPYGTESVRWRCSTTLFSFCCNACKVDAAYLK